VIIGGYGTTYYAETQMDCFWSRDFAISKDTDDLGCNIVPDDVSTDDCSCEWDVCMFDLETDPCEYYNLADDEDYTEVKEYMLAALQVNFKNSFC